VTYEIAYIQNYTDANTTSLGGYDSKNRVRNSGTYCSLLKNLEHLSTNTANTGKHSIVNS